MQAYKPFVPRKPIKMLALSLEVNAHLAAKKIAYFLREIMSGQETKD